MKIKKKKKKTTTLVSGKCRWLEMVLWLGCWEWRCVDSFQRWNTHQLLSQLSLYFVIQRLWRASQKFQLHVCVRILCSSIKASVVVTWHGSAAAVVFPRNPTRHSSAALLPVPRILLHLLPLAARQRAHAAFGEALEQLPAPVSKANERAWPLLRKQLHVHGIPQRPPNQAEKNNDWARVN